MECGWKIIWAPFYVTVGISYYINMFFDPCNVQDFPHATFQERNRNLTLWYTKLTYFMLCVKINHYNVIGTHDLIYPIYFVYSRLMYIVPCCTRNDLMFHTCYCTIYALRTVNWHLSPAIGMDIQTKLMSMENILSWSVIDLEWFCIESSIDF